MINFFASTDKQWADFSKKIIYNIYQYLKNKYHVSFLKILEPRYLRPIPTNMEGVRIFRKNIHYITKKFEFPSLPPNTLLVKNL